MANVFVRSGFFLSERKKLQELNSRLLLSSIDFIDASLWLLAGNRLPQALVMLHNAIEVALKGELERIHKILIANTKELSDFRALKSLLRDAFMKHPSGSGVEIPEFDIEKTIYFEEAFDRVAELYPGLSERWRQQLISSKGKKNKHSLHSLRNDIVHYGGDPDSTGRYTEAIVDIAFPFIEEFLKLASEDKVSLAHLVKEWIYREVEVARLVLRDLRNEKTPPILTRSGLFSIICCGLTRGGHLLLTIKILSLGLEKPNGKSILSGRRGSYSKLGTKILQWKSVARCVILNQAMGLLLRHKFSWSAHLSTKTASSPRDLTASFAGYLFYQKNAFWPDISLANFRRRSRQLT